MHTKEEKLKAFGRLLDVMDELREKCPWDRKQTYESLRPNTIEETPDFVTFPCHHIAHIENQYIKSICMVTQGDASEKMHIFAPCLYARKSTAQEPSVLWW